MLRLEGDTEFIDNIDSGIEGSARQTRLRSIKDIDIKMYPA